MKIVVLAGGTSTERDVSIVSGTMVCKGLREKGHDAILMDVFVGKEIAEGEQWFPEEYCVETEAEAIRSYNSQIAQLQKSRTVFFGPGVLSACRQADMVFLALHGENGEDGRVQAVFDLMGIRYTGCGHLPSALAMDKSLTKKLLAAGGVPVPVGIMLKKGREIPTPEQLGLKLPIVIKPCCGGSSVGVFIARDRESYEEAVKEAFSYEEEILAEAYVSGREFSVGVIEGKALPVIEIAPVEGFYDYKNKYSQGAAVETCPAELSEELTAKMQAYAEAGSRLLMMDGYSRWDFLMEESGDMYCLEANTLPGMTPTSLLPKEAQALGIEFAELCELLVEQSLKKYEEKSF